MKPRLLGLEPLDRLLAAAEFEAVPVFEHPVKLSAIVATTRVRVVIFFMCFPFASKRAASAR